MLHCMLYLKCQIDKGPHTPTPPPAKLSTCRRGHLLGKDVYYTMTHSPGSSFIMLFGSHQLRHDTHYASAQYRPFNTQSAYVISLLLIWFGAIWCDSSQIMNSWHFTYHLPSHTSQLCTEHPWNYFKVAKHCAFFFISHNLNLVFFLFFFYIIHISSITAATVQSKLCMITFFLTTVKHQTILS